MIEFVFASEQPDCSRATGQPETNLGKIEPGSADCAGIGGIGVDVLLASRKNQHSEVVQPWLRGCPPSPGPVGTCWSPSAKGRTSPFTAADSRATHRRSWQWHSQRNSRRLRASSGSSTNTRLQLNSIPPGLPGL